MVFTQHSARHHFDALAHAVFFELILESASKAEPGLRPRPRASGDHDVLERGLLSRIEVTIGVRHEVRALDHCLEQARGFRIEPRRLRQLVIVDLKPYELAATASSEALAPSAAAYAGACVSFAQLYRSG